MGRDWKSIRARLIKKIKNYFFKFEISKNRKVQSRYLKNGKGKVEEKEKIN